MSEAVSALADIRETALYKEAEALHKTLRQPGSGQVSDAQEINSSRDGRHAVFSGILFDTLEANPTTRICWIDLTSGDTRVLTFGPNVDRLPKYSPDGTQIAFLSDRAQAGDFQLYLLDVASGAARSAARVEGWVEYLHWSPDGTRVLLGVADHGADLSGVQGAITGNHMGRDIPSWIPAVDSGHTNNRRRRAWIYELAGGRVYPIGDADCNVWEATWCGGNHIAAVSSFGSSEGLWYSAHLRIIGAGISGSREIYTPKFQLGWPSASPSGERLAIVEAVCSDRWLVAGDLLLIDIASGNVRRVNTKGVDVTYTEWRSERDLLVAGHRGFETVIGLCDATSGAFTEVWASSEISGAGNYVTVSGFGNSGDCVLVGESFKRAPEIAVIRDGNYNPVRSFDLGYAEQAKAIEAVECVRWRAPDGLEIQGWLLRPKGTGPHPLVMNIHGGPVSIWHPISLIRARHVFLCLLIKRGYAIFLPNPRGSSGRGQDFARHVLGDMEGADTYDYLAGLDHLIEQGIADPKRLGVTGFSYGACMTSWLITQDSRFAAAVPVAPHANQVSAHLLCNIPQFVALFLNDHYTNAGGKYFQRSPIMHAHKAKTPTLNICGARDRSAPPSEAMQFHNALLENSVKSVLVTYPEEGHGVRAFPAAVDYAARVVSWFETYMAPD